MPPPDHDPTMGRPEAVSQATIGELLRAVNGRVEFPSEGYGESLGSLSTVYQGDPVEIHLSTTPHEEAEDGATVSINICYSDVITDERNEIWKFYPDDEGGQLTKTKGIEMPSDVVNDITDRTGGGKAWVDEVVAYDKAVKRGNKQMGLSNASEADARDLIEAIKSGKVIKERTLSVASVLRWLRITRG